MELSNQARHDNLPHDFAMEGTANVNVEAQSAAVGTQSTINFTSQDGTLTITGTEDALGKHIQIDISTVPSPVAPLVANLTVSPTNGVTPWTVTADASLSSGAVPIRTYAWNWGDGNTTPAGPAKTATHTYTTAGTYTVTVTVVDANGVTKTASKTVVSNGPTTGGVDLVVTAVSASPSSPVDGDAVTFSVTVKNNGTVAVPPAPASARTSGSGSTSTARARPPPRSRSPTATPASPPGPAPPSRPRPDGHRAAPGPRWSGSTPSPPTWTTPTASSSSTTPTTPST